MASAKIPSGISRTIASYPARLGLLISLFLLGFVAIIIGFREADKADAEVIQRSMQRYAGIMADAIRPYIDAEQADPSGTQLSQILARFDDLGELQVTTAHLQDLADPEDRFVMAATLPPIPRPEAAHLHDQLIRSGLFETLRGTCSQPNAGTVPFRLVDRLYLVGAAETLPAGEGCWSLIVTRRQTSGSVEEKALTPYWRKWEMLVVIVVYLLVAAATIWVFLDGWSRVRRFGRLAEEMQEREPSSVSLRAKNPIPDLDPAAAALDDMMASLARSSDAIRRAAEENAHAFKTPLATMNQALEPLRRALADAPTSTQRSLEVIQQSIGRLESLVQAVRNLDEATADLVNQSFRRVDLSNVLEEMAEDLADGFGGNTIFLETHIEPGLTVRGARDLIELSLENLIENAAGFSPPGGHVALSAMRRKGEIWVSVEDHGPGCTTTSMDRLFERYYTNRPENTVHGRSPHFGIGLWIVRRNIEAMGGRVDAANRPEGGFRVSLVFPVQDKDETKTGRSMRTQFSG